MCIHVAIVYFLCMCLMRPMTSTLKQFSYSYPRSFTYLKDQGAPERKPLLITTQRLYPSVKFCFIISTK